jgi:TolB protein
MQRNRQTKMRPLLSGWRSAVLLSGVAVLGAVALSGCSGASAGPGVPQGQGLIAFASFRENSDLIDIKVISPDGTNERLLVPEAASPAWRPDRRKLAFNRIQNGNVDVYVANADGSNPMRLTTNAALDFSPTWSPDGQQIAFVSNRDGQQEIYLMNADGSNQRRLTNRAEYDDYNPAWSPDGQHIAFEATPMNQGVRPSSIFLIKLDGTNLRFLTQPFTSDPAWHPNSQKLVFRDLNSLLTIDANGENLTRLPASLVEPVYSPDGSKIAGVNNADIYVINADGTNPVRLTNSPARDRLPDWR